MSSQKQPGAPRSSQEQPGAARRSQVQPGTGAVRGSQDEPGAAKIVFFGLKSCARIINVVWTASFPSLSEPPRRSPQYWNSHVPFNSVYCWLHR